MGRLEAVEPGHIVVGGHLGSIRITTPAALFLGPFPIGCNLTVSVQQDGKAIIAKSISRGEDEQVG